MDPDLEVDYVEDEFLGPCYFCAHLVCDILLLNLLTDHHTIEKGDYLHFCLHLCCYHKVFTCSPIWHSYLYIDLGNTQGIPNNPLFNLQSETVLILLPISRDII